MANQNAMVVAQTREWVARVVVGLNLCPFARKPFAEDLVKVTVSQAQSTEALLEDLYRELAALDACSPEDTETTLLVVPGMLAAFPDYNDFLYLAEGLVESCGWEGQFQIASFHPDYQFAGTEPEDAENYTNRAPWPTLHLLREDSLSLAVDSHPDPEGIPERNIATMDRMGEKALAALLAECRKAKP